MGYDPTKFFKKPESSSGVVVEYDPNVITRKSQRKAMSPKDIINYQREASRGGQIGSKQSNMGLNSSMAKSDRKIAVLAGIKNGTFKTVPQIAYVLQVSELTVKKYLKELGITYENQSGRILKRID